MIELKIANEYEEKSKHYDEFYKEIARGYKKKKISHKHFGNDPVKVYAIKIIKE